MPSGPSMVTLEFQSTLPVGGATGLPAGLISRSPNFNPRSPWGERLDLALPCSVIRTFQSTLPVGGATSQCPRRGRPSGHFNPRSPWGERRLELALFLPEGYFNPRSPWGERRLSSRVVKPVPIFQSTLPVGGATIAEQRDGAQAVISIHAPRGGSDQGVV